MITARTVAERCARAAAIASGISLAGLVGLISFNVLCRHLLRVPISGAYELAGFLGAVLVALALADYQLSGKTVVVDIFTRHYGKKTRAVLDCVNNLLSALFYGVLAWAIVCWGIRLAGSGEVSETLKIVYYPFVFVVALGFVLFSAALAVNAFVSRPVSACEAAGGES